MKKRIALIILLLAFLPLMANAQTSTVERQYKWYAEEKITVSSTAKQFTSEEYDYFYGATRITVDDPNSLTWTLNEVVTEGTTGAMGILRGYSAATSPTYLDIEILYNGLDSADFDPNNRLTGGTSGAGCDVAVGSSYTRGVAGYDSRMNVSPNIAEIHILDNSIIQTRNGATPVYSATDSACVGRKNYEGDTFYLFGTEQIESFKAVRAGGSDAIIEVRYGL